MTEAQLFSQPPGIASGAGLSPDGRYRYRLWRRWADGPLLGYVMLNPSTADASKDDPTIRRCIGFAKREGFAGIEVANMFAWRATKPNDLLTADDPEGNPENIRAIEAMFANLPAVVAAWGPNYPRIARRLRSLREDDRVIRMADRYSTRLMCLGVSKDGSPRHPLMVHRTQPFVPWPVPS